MKKYKSKYIKKILKEVAEMSKKRFSQEVCGLIGKNGDSYIIQECKNIAKDPRNNFVVDPVQFILFKNKNKLISIFHSHIVGDESPSDFDVIMSENSCIPFLIYSINTKKIHLYEPKNLDVDLKLLQKVNSKIKEYNILQDD